MPHETIDTTPDRTGAPEALRLAEEHHRLAEENRRLKRSERRREIGVFLAELREGGQLTPAMEQAGLEEALLSIREQPVSVTFPDGRQAPLSAVLGEVLRALPAGYCAGESAMGTEAEPVLSADERGIAGALGLSDREFAEIRASR